MIRKQRVVFPWECTTSNLKDVVLDYFESFMAHGTPPAAQDYFTFLSNDTDSENYFKHLFAALLLIKNGEVGLARTFMQLKCSCDHWQQCLKKFLNTQLDSRQHQIDLKNLLKTVERLTDLEAKIIFLKSTDFAPSAEQHLYKAGAYSAYYEQKKEDYSLAARDAWLDKQKNVYKILQEYSPKSVLDIGANTGWFSMLAEYLGPNVIATDIDEASVDILYNCAKEQNLNIEALVMPFERLLDHGSDRLKSDMVLCLALVHHLVFASGLKLEEIFDVLSKLTKHVLVLEYVDLTDKALNYGLTHVDFWRNETDFKKALKILQNYANKSYNLPTILEVGEKYFSSVKILDSHPHTRKLIVFIKNPSA